MPILAPPAIHAEPCVHKDLRVGIEISDAWTQEGLFHKASASFNQLPGEDYDENITVRHNGHIYLDKITGCIVIHFKIVSDKTVHNFAFDEKRPPIDGDSEFGPPEKDDRTTGYPSFKFRYGHQSSKDVHTYKLFAISAVNQKFYNIDPAVHNNGPPPNITLPIEKALAAILVILAVGFGLRSLSRRKGIAEFSFWVLLVAVLAWSVLM